MKKILCAGALAILLAACGGKSAESGSGKPEAKGQAVYESQCSRCHGSNGKLGLSGAKDLSVTTLTPAEMVPVIGNGSGGGMMPAFNGQLTPEEIKDVADYIEASLKN